MPDRFYGPDPPVEGRIVLTGEEARHLARILRHGPGDLVEVFDGRGGGFHAEVQHVVRDRIELAVRARVPDRSPARAVVLATAVPKGERFDWLVEKATEVGVARLIPLIAERSVVDPRATKLERLRRTVVEASKQCGRNQLMELSSPMRWTELLPLGASRTCLLAHPGGAPAGSWSRFRRGGERGLLLAIGPEGGFTDAEVERATDAGWGVIGLGQTRLRIETAALVGCALVFREDWEDS